VVAVTALHKGLWAALQAGNFNAVATLARAIDQNVEAAARLAGEWPIDEVPHSVTNVQVLSLPGIGNILSGITKALASHPAARAAVIEFLRQAEQPALPAPLLIEASGE
jgi:hypothetical protein